MSEIHLIPFRKYSRPRLSGAIGADAVERLEEFLTSKGIAAEYPIGWILDYAKTAAEDPERFRKELVDLADSLHQEGCATVFAFVEWQDMPDWEEQRDNAIAIFQTLQWVVSPPFAAYHRPV